MTTARPSEARNSPPESGEAEVARGLARQVPVAFGSDASEPVGARALSKLKWRCRRGLLENDLFIARFFERHETDLTCGQARALETLMDLSDNDLLDLLLQRKEPEQAGVEVVELLQLMRVDGAQSLPSRTIL